MVDDYARFNTRSFLDILMLPTLYILVSIALHVPRRRLWRGT